jgi:hypothetical protein
MKLENAHLSRRQMLWAGAGAVGGLAARAPSAARANLPVDRTDAGPGPDCVTEPEGELPVEEIEEIMTTKGRVCDGVLTITLGRTDLEVMAPNGCKFQPDFEPHHTFHFQALRDDEVFMNAEVAFRCAELECTIKALLGTPLVYMAGHPHFMGEQPQLFHHYFHGRGKAKDVAKWAMKVVCGTSTPLCQEKPKHPTTSLPTDDLAQILHGKAHVECNGVVMVDVTRPDRFTQAGVRLLPDMDVKHTIAFHPLNSSGSQALCGPAYALRDEEVELALRQSLLEEFEIHCLYNRHTKLEPDLFFSHHLKCGKPLELAQAVRRVLKVLESVCEEDD